MHEMKHRAHKLQRAVLPIRWLRLGLNDTAVSINTVILIPLLAALTLLKSLLSELRLQTKKQCTTFKFTCVTTGEICCFQILVALFFESFHTP
ncbi:hypothetical protein EDB19DRAFT_360620 [Suillus lakei]|nr:hypothetical protein EDB19DRAFT_360620 [Suillus lakei]